MKHRNDRRDIMQRNFDIIAYEIEQRKRTQEKNLNPNQDSINRRKVVSTIESLMKKGITQQHAVDMIMQDIEMVKQFSYLTKNGLDIRQCFINWSNSIYKSKSIEEERER